MEANDLRVEVNSLTVIAFERPSSYVHTCGVLFSVSVLVFGADGSSQGTQSWFILTGNSISGLCRALKKQTAVVIGLHTFMQKHRRRLCCMIAIYLAVIYRDMNGMRLAIEIFRNVLLKKSESLHKARLEISTSISKKPPRR